ncbi:MAG: hypothetical protein V1876_00715, partial [Candidatus Peregrinibacteria bacterium]
DHRDTLGPLGSGKHKHSPLPGNYREADMSSVASREGGRPSFGPAPHRAHSALVPGLTPTQTVVRAHFKRV